MRRDLKFDSLTEAAADATNLLDHGYQCSGNWNLSQVCGHLEQWMCFPMDGFPRPPFPMNMILAIMKATVAKAQLRQILNDGFRPGIPTMPATVVSADASSDAVAVASFLSTIERFIVFEGPVHSSPLFGAMDRETANALQRRHCEHHLSFLTGGNVAEGVR